MSDTFDHLPQTPEPEPTETVDVFSSPASPSPVETATPPRKRRTALIAGLVALVIWRVAYRRAITPPPAPPS